VTIPSIATSLFVYIREKYSKWLFMLRVNPCHEKLQGSRQGQLLGAWKYVEWLVLTAHFDQLMPVRETRRAWRLVGP